MISYLHRHTFSETGKLLKVERRVIGRPVQDSYTTYQHDQGISYEYMIERNIPGYAEMPVSGNQPVSAKRYKPTGELISESIYHNRYNSEGQQTLFLIEKPAAGDPVTLISKDFKDLDAGETLEITYQVQGWRSSQEFPPPIISCRSVSTRISISTAIRITMMRINTTTPWRKRDGEILLYSYMGYPASERYGLLHHKPRFRRWEE